MEYPSYETRPQCKAKCPITYSAGHFAFCGGVKGHPGPHQFDFSLTDKDLGIETTEKKAIRLLRGAFEWVPRAAEVAPEVEAFLEEVSS